MLLEQLTKIEAATTQEGFSQAPSQQQRMVLSAALQMLQKVMAAIDTVPEADRAPLMHKAKIVYEAIERCERDVNANPEGEIPYRQALETLLTAQRQRQRQRQPYLSITVCSVGGSTGGGPSV